MGVLDFLFQGSPPPSINTYGQTTTDVPAWYNDYTQGLIARANAVAAEPYQAYGFPRLAGLDPAQQQAYQKAYGLESMYQPIMNQAVGSAVAAGQGSALSAASPYFQQALGYNPLTAAQPLLGEAANFARLSSADTSGLAQPYLAQAGQYTTQGAGGTAGLAQPYIGEASQMTRQGAQGTAGLASPYLTQAGQYTTQGAAGTAGLGQPYLTQAGQMTTQGAGATAGLATPYIQQAIQQTGAGGQSAVGGIEAYMNPYTEQVVNRIGELGARTLREQLLPQIQDQSIAAGQFGGTRGAEQIGRAIRDTQEGISAQQAQALQQGYTQAAGLAQQDLSRQLQAAGQTGALGQSLASLSAADQQRLLSAAGQQAAIGQSMAGLSAADQQRLLAAGQQAAAIGQAQAGLSAADQQRLLSAAGQQAALGQSLAGLSAADQQRLLAAGSQAAALGQATAGLEAADLARMAQTGQQLGALGQQTGALTGQAGTLAAQIGQQYGALSQQDLARQLQSAQTLGGLGQMQQQLGVSNIGALEAAGQAQQQQTQRSLDLAYQDFLEQRGWDKDQIAFLNNAIRGLQIPTTQSTQAYGPTSVYQPSPLSQMAQGAATAYGLTKLFGGT